MMRLPPFAYAAPTTVDEAVRILAGEAGAARLVAGGTDLLPNLKRRHQAARTLVATRRLAELKGSTWEAGGGLRIGAATTLRALEQDPGLGARFPALWTAVHAISTPTLRHMGTIGGNVCLDTRCNYYNQNWEWRRAIDFCMKCEGETCWVAPSSPRCWAVSSSDSVPVLIALGARARLQGSGGERILPLHELFRDDGIDYLAKGTDEVLIDLHLPPPDGWRCVYRKVRRRGTYDFPVLGVAVALRLDGGRVEEARIVLGGVGSAPLRAEEACRRLVGRPLGDEAIREVADRAWHRARPLDNTDHEHGWRKKMVRVEVRRALETLRERP